MEFDKENAAAIGRAIYREKIRPTLGPEHKGKIVVIDVKSGDYEIADGPLKGHLQAVRKLRERRPDAYTWDEWVDVPVTYRVHPSVVTRPYSTKSYD